MNLKERILLHGVKNCLFMVPMRPVRRIMGIGFTSSSDEPVTVPALIDESRYYVADNYKITLRSILPGFGSEVFYLSDLASFVNDDTIRFYVQVVRKN